MDVGNENPALNPWKKHYVERDMKNFRYGELNPGLNGESVVS
jgi:hypothetical protein